MAPAVIASTSRAARPSSGSASSGCGSGRACPVELCGTWSFEYRSPYNEYEGTCTTETCKLLSCGAAFYASLELYSEGQHYFCRNSASGWGRWYMDASGKVVVRCRVTHATTTGSPGCDAERPKWTNTSSRQRDSVLELDREHFKQKFARAGLFDCAEEARLRAEMAVALEQMQQVERMEMERQPEACSRVSHEREQQLKRQRNDVCFGTYVLADKASKRIQNASAKHGGCKSKWALAMIKRCFAATA